LPPGLRQCRRKNTLKKKIVTGTQDTKKEGRDARRSKVNHKKKKKKEKHLRGREREGNGNSERNEKREREGHLPSLLVLSRTIGDGKSGEKRKRGFRKSRVKKGENPVNG